MAKKKTAVRKARLPKSGGKKAQPLASPDFTTYTIRAIPTPDWTEFKHKLDANGHKVNWVMAELIRRVGAGDIVLGK